MAGNPSTFITLTANPAFAGSPLDRRRELAKCWNIVCKRIKRTYGLKSVPFFAVVEKTKRGEPHLHILARLPFVPQRWLSAQMADLMKSPIVDIRRITDLSKAAWYVSKYIGKEPAQFGTTKRYWQSRDYTHKAQNDPPEHGGNSDGWYVVREPIHQVLLAYGGTKWEVIHQPNGKVLVFTKEQYERHSEDRIRQISRNLDCEEGWLP